MEIYYGTLGALQYVLGNILAEPSEGVKGKLYAEKGCRRSLDGGWLDLLSRRAEFLGLGSIPYLEEQRGCPDSSDGC